MNSFLNWIGGKKLLRDQVIKRFPVTHKTYVEVFGGGGWVLFRKEKSQVEIYNDITTELTNLFLQVKYHPDALQKELEFMLPSRKLFSQLKNFKAITEIQKAVRFFYLIKYSFAAKGETFNANANHCPPSISNAIAFLQEVSGRLDKVTIENLDFARCIKKYDAEETFFYCDPPYYRCQNYDYIGATFTGEHHQRLADLLHKTAGQWLLSYNDTRQIIDLYDRKGITIERISRNNNMGKCGNRVYHELLIRNY